MPNLAPDFTETHLAPETHMGRLELRVRDMATMLAYYSNGVGLEPISDEPGAVVLGQAGKPIVRLSEANDLRPASRNEAGLFHTAIVYEGLPQLSKTLVSLFQQFPETYSGTGDHWVSQAFYFTDPEGNGVELYHDRPRDLWKWNGSHVAMGTDYIDPMDFLRTHLGGVDLDSLAPTEAELGHVHLQVGDIQSARGFYVDALGFDETAALGNTALFVSAGGYHHYMAMNVWNSRGAGPRNKTLGMGVVDILVPTDEELAMVNERLKFHGRNVTFDGRTLSALDPWNNEIRLSVA